jgi:hypothetical protein
VYFTTDNGVSWTQLTANLPTTRYDELIVHPRTKDLVMATHGRSIWILDDVSPIAEWTPGTATESAHLFPVRTATIVNYWADVSTAAHGIYAAPNPDEGAVFSYHLATTAQSVKFVVTNGAGRVIRELNGPATANQLHRVNWDLRYPPFTTAGARGGPPPGEAEDGSGARTALPTPAHNIGPRGFYVSPGKYTVTMDVDGRQTKMSFDVRADPAMMMSVADHKAREEFLLDAQDVQVRLAAAISQFRARLAQASAADSAQLNAIAVKFNLLPPSGGSGFRRPSGPLSELAGLAGAWNGSGARHGGLQAPSGTHRKVLSDAKAVLAEIERAIR